MQGQFPYPSAFNQSDATAQYELVESGDFSLGQIPLVTIYANKTDTMTSKPPLLDIAHLNLAHYQRQADLLSTVSTSLRSRCLSLRVGTTRRKTWLSALITRWRPSRVTRSITWSLRQARLRRNRRKSRITAADGDVGYQHVKPTEICC